MGEFRIGRGRAQHSYPDSKQDTTLPFARNFAQGPTDTTVIAIAPGGTQIPWAVIESGAPAGVNVPITPHVTGRVRVRGMVTISNTDEGPHNVTVQLLGAPLPEAQATIEAGNFITIPLETDITLPVGVTVNIIVLVTTNTGNQTVVLTAQSSTLDLQEVPLAN